MDLRTLRYFTVLAEELHFGRAAARLLVAQPSLSYAIKELERELGVGLFVREPRGVRLTEAGAEVLAEARRTLHQAERVAAVAARHRAGEVGALRVGFQATGAGAIGTLALARFARRHPAARVEPKRVDWGGEAAALREGRADVAFVWLPADGPGLHLDLLAVEPRVVGVARDHPLAGRAAVAIMDLAGEPLMWTRKAPRAWVDWWAVNPRPDGSEPLWGPTNDSVEEMLEQVAMGAGVCIAPASMATYYARPDVAWLPLSDVEPLRIALGWRADDASPLVQSFAAVVREVADEIAADR